jgi:hypothetical protein
MFILQQVLHLGVMMLQVNPTPTPVAYTGEQVTDVIDAIDRTANTFQDFTIGIAVLFVAALFALALIAFFYFNRNASKGAQDMMTTFAQAMGRELSEKTEQLDRLEEKQGERDEKYIESLAAIADSMNRIADVTDSMRRNESGRDRVLADATAAMTAIVTVGSKPLQQVVQDMGGLREADNDIKREISRIYDMLITRFPIELPVIDQIRDMVVEAAKEVAFEKKHDTGELPPITLPKASGE